MDVNGSRFHLLAGESVWGACFLEGEGASLSQFWAQRRELEPESIGRVVPLEGHDASASLRLTRRPPLFRRAGVVNSLDLDVRRGAARDRYGNWYWIGPDQRSLRFRPAMAGQSVRYWRTTDLNAACTTANATFATMTSPPPQTIKLRGLAVTTHHYLVAGYFEPEGTDHGVFVFDLHGGGTPMIVRWPTTPPFKPWDLAPVADGSTLILDRANRTYWVLSPSFQLKATVEPAQEATFQPLDPTSPVNLVRGAIQPAGFPLSDVINEPISIEAGPGDNVLILDKGSARGFSIVYLLREGVVQSSYSLENAAHVSDPDDSENETTFSVIGHDFAFIAAPPTAPKEDCGCEPTAPPANGEGNAEDTSIIGVLYVADVGGKQAFAFDLGANGELRHRVEYLPMRRWSGRALLAVEDQVYYDIDDRWVRLTPFNECHYDRQAVITTPVRFPRDPGREDDAPLPGEPFDGRLPGCVWHRFLLDARIPAGCSVRVSARAADDRNLLEVVPWLAQPDPYLRSGGAEIPYLDPWADLREQGPLPERTGSWELLFQRIEGRYLQIKLTITGTGRSTPELRALRVWYPRFSYLDHYLPAIYREEPRPGPFLERWLANFEGLYTNLEEKIEHVDRLFDPRTAPRETLEWLACWFGLALDPLWDEKKRRVFIRNIDKLFRKRGTARGVEIAVRLFLDTVVCDDLFDLREVGTGQVRIVEQFLTRGVGGSVYGDTTDTGERKLRDLTPGDVRANAHRFTVLVPHDLGDEALAMVERIVTLEKPAHTEFALKRYLNLFRVGEARVGLDTRLGPSSRFAPLTIGDGFLADSYLEYPYPFDVEERVISDRDWVGALPAL